MKKMFVWLMLCSTCVSMPQSEQQISADLFAKLKKVLSRDHLQKIEQGASALALTATALGLYKSNEYFLYAAYLMHGGVVVTNGYLLIDDKKDKKPALRMAPSALCFLGAILDKYQYRLKDIFGERVFHTGMRLFDIGTVATLLKLCVDVRLQVVDYAKNSIEQNE